MDRAMALALEEQQGGVISQDTICTFNSHLQIAELRKAIFIFLAVLLVAVGIDWIHSCADLKSHKEVFGHYQ